MAVDGPAHDQRVDTSSTAELVGQAAAQISTLIRDELTLGLAGAGGSWQFAIAPIPHDTVASVTADANAVRTAVRDGRPSSRRRLPTTPAADPDTGRNGDPIAHGDDYE